MGGGLADPRQIPVALLARAYRRVLQVRGARLLGYGDPRGEPALRGELARLLAASRGLAVGPEEILVTRGAQMALALATRLLIRPGDRVGVERYGYRPVWDALRLAGARLVPLPVDAGGVRVGPVEAALERGPLRALYLTPHHQYPTMALLAPARRRRLLELARRHRFAVLEDDYDHEFHYRGRPVLPLASRDPTGQVVYVGGLSKVLAPGLRIGFLVAAPRLVERATELRKTWDRQGDLPTEAAVAELLASGEIPRHVRKMRRLYAARRAALQQELTLHLDGALEVPDPPGGLALWCRVRGGVDPGAWAAAAARGGVEVSPARRFVFSGRPGPFLRVGFAACDEGELARGVGVLARCWRDLRGGPRRPQAP